MLIFDILGINLSGNSECTIPANMGNRSEDAGKHRKEML